MINAMNYNCNSICECLNADEPLIAPAKPFNSPHEPPTNNEPIIVLLLHTVNIPNDVLINVNTPINNVNTPINNVNIPFTVNKTITTGNTGSLLQILLIL
eukprot:1000782_1